MSLFLRCRRSIFFEKPLLLRQIPVRLLSALPSQSPPNSDPRSSLSARLSFVFDQIDAIDREKDRPEKDRALQLIRQWRESRKQSENISTNTQEPEDSSLDANKQEMRDLGESFLARKKDVELVHPWPEWIELMERLGQQKYFDRRVKSAEEQVAESAGIELDEVREEVGLDFWRDWTTVRKACMDFGKDRFDILRSLSRKDLQILVGHGCPSMDPKVVFSAKLLRKLTHLNEGDVCSSCNLRNSCSRGYILTLKDDEARTLDVVRILLTYGFDHINGAVENKALMQMKSVKTVIRKLLHEIVKLSAVPIDPNLPPPVIKKPPPKVKQPPPQPKRRVGRNDVEMKKGDWLCQKCDFMNFAKNTVCMQCDAKRPKRQLLPGEWECPQCNFLNYRRNMACFHCDAKRPPDEFTENQFEPRQSGPRMRMDRPARVQDVSNAWNFDFDDNESDGADVAAFEFANSPRTGDNFDVDDMPRGRTPEGFENDKRNTSRTPRSLEGGRYFSADQNERSADRTGFDDFDDEEDVDDDDDVDSYELDGSNDAHARGVSVKNFSDVESASESEEFSEHDRRTNFNPGARDYTSGSEENEDELADHPQLKATHVADSWQKSRRSGAKSLGSDDLELGSDFDDDDDDEDFGSKQRKHRQQSSGRKGIRRRLRDSDSDDGLLLDSDSDGDGNNIQSYRNNLRGNKGFSDRRGKPSNFGSARREEFRSEDRRHSRKSSFHDRDDDFSSRGPHRGGYAERRGNGGGYDKFDRVDGGARKERRSTQFGDRSSGTRRNERGSYGDERGGRRGSGGFKEFDRFESFDKVDGSVRRGRQSGQFRGRSTGSRRNERGPRGDENGRRRGDDGLQRGRRNRFE